jgi:hypothetical protein
LVNVPIGILLIVLGSCFIPNTAKREAAPIDFMGIALFGLLLLSSMAGIGRLGSGGTTLVDPVFLGLEGLAVVLAAIFVRHIRTAEMPFIPARLIFGRGFFAVNVLNTIFGSAALGMGALIPLYAEDRFKISSLSAGTLLTTRSVGMMAVAGLAVLALRRSGYRRPMIGGFLLLAFGLMFVAATPRELSPYAWLAAGAGIAGIGMGLLLPASNNAMLHLAPDQIAGTAGLRGMFRMSGGIFAVSITTAIVARSSDPGLTLGHAFFVFGILITMAIPLIRLVPEHRGSW